MNTRVAKRILAVLSAVLGVGLATTAAAQNKELGSTGELLDGVAAVVDEGVVLKSELTESMQVVMENLRAQQAKQPPEQRQQLPPMSLIEKQVLEQLIVKEIELQRAKRLGITVGDDMLNQALSRVAQNLGYTLAELPAVLAGEKIDYAMYREDSRKDLIIEQLQQRDVLSRITITPRELEQCLAQREAKATDQFDYNISHILIGISASATPDEVAAARKKIDDIYARLQGGEDFARLAVEESQAQTALNGGSLGWRKGSELPTLFSDLVVNMKPGDFSEPIQSGGGFQIVKLNDMRGAERTLVNQLHVRHILLRPNEILDDAAVKQKLIGIREQIEGGDAFNTVAQAVSEDATSATEGGDLGWVSPGDLPPEFEQVLADLKIGELSQPFKTRYGWHLAEVTEERSYDKTDEMKQQECQQQIRASKAEEERELWLRKLRDQAYVDIRL
jgi:peptidyl-prolyl cis-trans isomerase SurA